ncbi:MAG: hypothetical protein ACPGVU_24840 [Limisphaerales bacterium]
MAERNDRGDFEQEEIATPGEGRGVSAKDLTAWRVSSAVMTLLTMMSEDSALVVALFVWGALCIVGVALFLLLMTSLTPELPKLTGCRMR